MADFDITISDGTAIEVVVTPANGTGAGVSDHGELTGLADDDHALYHTDARGDARYKPLAYVPAWTDITGKPSVFPPDTHNHDALYSPLGHNHDDRYFTETEADARYLQSVPGSYATDAEVATAISDHEAASDPHTGYQKESEKDQNNGYAGLDSSGRVPIARLASGTPDGTKFVRDDGVLATPAGGGSTLTKVYAAQSSAVSISASVYTKMTFTTTGEIDSLSEFDPATGTFTAASTKRVHFIAQVAFASHSSGYRIVRFYKNGSQTRFAVVMPPVTGDITCLLLSAYLDLTSGDTVDVRALCVNTSGAVSLNSDINFTTFEAHGVS